MLKLWPAKIDNILVKDIKRGHQQFSFIPINGQLAAANGGGMEVVVCKSMAKSSATIFSILIETTFK